MIKVALLRGQNTGGENAGGQNAGQICKGGGQNAGLFKTLEIRQKYFYTFIPS